MAGVFLAAAGGFVYSGGRLFLMLKRFPIESRGRRKKLREVGAVMSICTAAFASRALLLALATSHGQQPGLDALGHPLLNLGYYTLSEILPMALVLFLLRKLPPARRQGGARGYQQARSSRSVGSAPLAACSAPKRLDLLPLSGNQCRPAGPSALRAGSAESESDVEAGSRQVTPEAGLREPLLDRTPAGAGEESGAAASAAGEGSSPVSAS